MNPVNGLSATTVIIESAKAAASEFQAQIAAILADAHSKLTEITTAATSASEAKTAAETAALSQAQVATVLADAQTKLTEITTVATNAVAANTKITDFQAVIATKSEHIQGAQEHADKVRAELDRTLTSATQQVTATEAQKTSAQAAAESATKLLSEIQTAKVEVETEAGAVVASRKAAEESASMLKGLADKSATVEARIVEYEKRLNAFENRSVELLDKSEKYYEAQHLSVSLTPSMPDVRASLSRVTGGNGHLLAQCLRSWH